MHKSTKPNIFGIIVTIIAGLLSIYYGLDKSLYVLIIGLIFILSAVIMLVKRKYLAGYISLINSIFLGIILFYNCIGYDYRHIWNNAWFFPVPFLGIIGFVISREAFNRVELKPYLLILISEVLLLPWAILTIADGIFPLTEYRAAVLLSYPAIWIAAGLLFLYLVWFSYTSSSLKNGIVCCIASFALVFFVVITFFKHGTQLFLLGTGSVFLFVPVIILSIILTIIATVIHFKKRQKKNGKINI